MTAVQVATERLMAEYVVTVSPEGYEVDHVVEFDEVERFEEKEELVEWMCGVFGLVPSEARELLVAAAEGRLGDGFIQYGY